MMLLARSLPCVFPVDSISSAVNYSEGGAYGCCLLTRSCVSCESSHDRRTVLQQHDVSSRVKMHLLSQYQEKWRAAATKLVRLLDYVSLNMQALRLSLIHI